MDNNAKNISQQIIELREEMEQRLYNLTGKKLPIMIYGLDSFVSKENVELLINQICQTWGLNSKELKQPDRFKHLVTMRFIVFYAIKKMYPLFGWVEIGKIFACDHSTVINGFERAKERIDVKDPTTMLYYNAVKHFINE